MVWTYLCAVGVVDCFYVALFSTLEQTNCALVACDSKRVTRFLKIFFMAHFEYPPEWCTDSTVWLLHAGAMGNCCCLSAFCVHPTTMQHVTSLMLSNMHRVHVCLTLTSHLHFWQNDQDLLHATVVTQGWSKY